MATKGLDTGEIFESITSGSEERLVDAEIVRITVHIGDRPTEGNHFVTKIGEEFLVSVLLGRETNLHQCLRITSVIGEPGGLIPSRITLRDKHDSDGVISLGGSEGLAHPGDVGGIAGSVFSGVRVDVAEIVAGTLDVQGGVGDAAHGPAAILDTGSGTVHAQAEWRGLHLLEERMPAESVWRAEE